MKRPGLRAALECDAPIAEPANGHGLRRAACRLLTCELSPEALVAMLLYSLASSSMLILNKMAMHRFPLPSSLSVLQFAATTATIAVIKAAGVTAVDDFEWRKVKPYLVYVAMFCSTIYCNLKALEHSNIETVIVARACCPVVVSLLDWAFLGRQLPSARSLIMLVLLIAGACAYVLTDRAFKMNGLAAYTWVGAYFVIISLEMAYGKHIVGPHLGFKSMWGPTLYTNALSILPMAVAGVATGEVENLALVQWDAPLIALLLCGCIVSTAISYLGWWSRSLVTATCYTVLGVGNKMVSVLVSALLFADDTSATGMLSLAVCLLAAVGYRQAPLRNDNELEGSMVPSHEPIRPVALSADVGAGAVSERASSERAALCDQKS